MIIDLPMKAKDGGNVTLSPKDTIKKNGVIMKATVESRLLAILSCDDWKSRKQIARELGRPRGLASNDIHWLNVLVRAGKIERAAYDYREMQRCWQYRKVRR